MDSNTRIAVNTTILYAQLIITVVVNLFSTRLILNAMGVEDYGIVNLIAGIVAMLSFVQNSMTVSSQRYMSVYMGRHDDALQKKVFNTSMALHLLFVIGVLTILESCQSLIFNSSIQIPVDRIESAKFLYQLTILGTLFTIMSVPYDATINAHEDMLAFSAISIIESIVRLTGALILLVYYSDKLVFYGFLIVVIRLSSFVFKYLFCKSHYTETKTDRNSVDVPLMKEMFSFAFWNMFGVCALTGRNQGVAIVLNTFLGVVVNTSYGIANQIGGQLSNFTSAIIKAMNPQIMQNAGVENNEKVISLSLMQCKFSSLLLLISLVPLFLTLPFVLKVWLNIIPENTVPFCRCFLIVNLLMQMATGLMTAIQSSGKIRTYQISVSCILLFNLPLGYFALKMGHGGVSVLMCMIFVELMSLLFRVYYVSHVFGMKYTRYFNYVFIPVVAVLLICGSISYSFNKFLLGGVNDFFSFGIACLFSVTVGCFFSYIALTNNERFFVKTFSVKLFQKLINYNKSI